MQGVKPKNLVHVNQVSGAYRGEKSIILECETGVGSKIKDKF